MSSGRIAAIISLEGGQGIENNLNNLRNYYNRGFRSMTLTHAKSLDWAESAGDQGNPELNGLNDFGRRVVAEMNSMGMMVDLAHVSENTFWATLDATQCPVIVSHAAARGISDHPRNLSDDQLRAVAQRGGVVGVIYYCKYLDVTGQKPCNAGLVADHIDYIKKVAGVDAVALGSDFDGNVKIPSDLADASKVPNLTAELVRRGYSEQDIRKILGENFLAAWARIQACR